MMRPLTMRIPAMEMDFIASCGVKACGFGIEDDEIQFPEGRILKTVQRIAFHKVEIVEFEPLWQTLLAAQGTAVLIVMIARGAKRQTQMDRAPLHCGCTRNRSCGDPAHRVR